MTAPATILIDALKTHLQGITAANGYAVTVASVSTGRSALAGDYSGPYPALTLTPLQDTPGDTTQPDACFQQWNRTLILEAALVGTAQWDADLDTLWDAIRHRLTRYPGILTWGVAELIPPAEGGDLCLLRLPLTLPYTLSFTE